MFSQNIIASEAERTGDWVGVIETKLVGKPLYNPEEAKKAGEQAWSIYGMTTSQRHQAERQFETVEIQEKVRTVKT